VIGLSQQFQQRLLSAQSAYEQASSRLAAAETAQPVASSGPVRYARGPVDLASCGCLNPDTATGPNSSELAAAKAAEAEAAAELAKAKAEARQFLESVKNSGNVAGNTSSFSPLW
jgi:multidrug efflux pump subunit AcrA (membrane-fusion protein)